MCPLALNAKFSAIPAISLVKINLPINLKVHISNASEESQK